MRTATALAAAVWAGAVAALPTQTRSTTLPSSWKWVSTGPLVFPKNDERNIAGIKDPTAVLINGTYHVFASTAKSEGYNMVYFNFTDFAEANNAPFYYLDQAPLGYGYRAAPQVFYFEPHKLWYLVYQNGNAAYSTNPDINDPSKWTAPEVFYPNGMPKIIADNIGNGYWVDMWVVCDDEEDPNKALCHLFSSDDNGHLYRSQTTLAQFPRGMSEPEIVLQDTQNIYALWEAACIYRIKGAEGTQKYLLLVEAIGQEGHRYFRSWTSDRIDGQWIPLADTEANPWAGEANVVFEGQKWTKSISHGEVIRTLTDQTLTLDLSEPIQFLYQGVDPNAQTEYNALPWRLGLITQVL
ncbi:hypothetical protein VTJ04DRAFT_4048 [Mycothermus thermophilus]|uniref:Alpha-L-arabinofuranosidase n=1 Tax=Humicola insolens TaxID=85995 RepID=A0A059U759_HUMIN|nr:alpha-arabinofuranosidase [Mycothermus thermophilus]